MNKAVSAVEANRHFSRILRAVREGESYLVTSHGKPVAQITPVGTETDVDVEARRQLLSRLSSEPVVDATPWTREELYGR